jgi:hypothetical protein
MPLSSVVGAQSIVRPGVCTSSTRPASPYDGQVIYETDTDKIRIWDSSAWSTIDTVYSTWTPTYTNFTLGNGTQAFAYAQVGKLIHLQGQITWGSTTSISGLFQMTIPTSDSTSYDGIFGHAYLIDNGVADYVGFVQRLDASNIILRAINASGTYASYSNTSSTVPFTWGNGDKITMNLVYRGA